MTQEQAPSERTTGDSQPEATTSTEIADQPDPALQSILQEADRPDVSLVSEMTKALKPGQHRPIKPDHPTEH